MDKETILKYYRRQKIALPVLIIISIFFLLLPLYGLFVIGFTVWWLTLILLIFIIALAVGVYGLIKTWHNRKEILRKIRRGELPERGELNTTSFKVDDDQIKVRLLIKQSKLVPPLLLFLYSNGKKVAEEKIGSTYKTLQIHRENTTLTLPNGKEVLVRVFWKNKSFFSRVSSYDEIRAEVFYNGSKKGLIKFWAFPE